MAYRDRSTYSAPDDQRCEALAKPNPNAGPYVWQRFWRRCHRRANQSREGRSVCFQHAAIPNIRWYDRDNP